jgi:hypothetical protein
MLGQGKDITISNANNGFILTYGTSRFVAYDLYGLLEHLTKALGGDINTALDEILNAKMSVLNDKFKKVQIVKKMGGGGKELTPETTNLEQ